MWPCFMEEAGVAPASWPISRAKPNKEAMTAFFSEITREGEIIELSSGVEAVLGRPAVHLLGQPWTVLYEPNPDLEAILHSAGPWGEPPVTVRLRADGVARSARVLPLWENPGGNSVAFGTWVPGPPAGSDTDRLVEMVCAGALESDLAEYGFNLLRSPLEYYPASVGLYDAEGHLLYLNAEGRRRTGYDLESIRGLRDEELFPAELTERYVPALRHALTRGERTAAEIRLHGGREILSIVYVPIPRADGAVARVLGVTHDVTAQRHAEEDLQRRNDELEALTRILEIGLGRRDMREAFNAILDEVRDFLGFSLASIQSYREESGKMVVETVRGIPGFSGEPLVAPVEESACSEMIRRGRPLVSTADCLSDTWYRRLRFDGTLRARLCVPVKAEQEVIGAMCLAHTEPVAITGRMLQWCDSIANYVGMIISRKRAEEALHESELRLARTEAISLVMVAHVGLNGKWLKVPPTLTELLGYSQQELLHQRFLKSVHPADRQNCIERTRQLLDGKARSLETEIRMLPRDGRVVWIYINSSLVLDDVGRPLYVLAFIRDITPHKHQEEELRLAARLFESSGEGIMVTDANRTIISVNAAFTELTGYPPEEVLGKTPQVLRSGRHDEAFYRNMYRSLERTGQWQGEIWNRKRDGTLVPELMTISAVTDEKGNVTHYVGMFRDISELKHYEDLLEQRANYDSLTGLPNRGLFFDRLSHGMEKALRSRRRLAVLFVDLDNFKEINDTLGHETGDELLKEVTGRLTDCTRSEDTVARLGGDEFVVLMEDIDNSNDAADSALRIKRAISRSLTIAGRRLRVSCSIGISVFPEDGRRADALVKNADTAMYQAKQAGRNRYRFFTREMNARAANRLAIESQLKRALKRNEFFLAYQPRWEIVSGRITGFEAMLRWRHPEDGIREAAEFIAIAEDSGMIAAIDHWVLHAVAGQLGLWRASGRPPVPVSINLSAQQLSRGHLLATVRNLAADSRLDPRLLEVELKEDALRQGEALDRPLHELHRLGARLSIDDYGIGCSSLSRLKALPVDRLKIDQSIIQGLSRPEQAAVSDAIIAAGHSMRFKVLAEGVENAAQLGFLREHGCDEAQGNFLGRPLPAGELAQWG